MIRLHGGAENPLKVVAFVISIRNRNMPGSKLSSNTPPQAAANGTGSSLKNNGRGSCLGLVPSGCLYLRKPVANLILIQQEAGHSAAYCCPINDKSLEIAK